MKTQSIDDLLDDDADGIPAQFRHRNRRLYQLRQARRRSYSPRYHLPQYEHARSHHD